MGLKSVSASIDVIGDLGTAEMHCSTCNHTNIVYSYNSRVDELYNSQHAHVSVVLETSYTHWSTHQYDSKYIHTDQQAVMHINAVN